MADQLDDDGDEEWFKEVYGAEYTGLQRHHRTHGEKWHRPSRPTTTNG
jgi:hypothetical protein